METNILFLLQTYNILCFWFATWQRWWLEQTLFHLHSFPHRQATEKRKKKQLKSDISNVCASDSYVIVKHVCNHFYVKCVTFTSAERKNRLKVSIFFITKIWKNVLYFVSIFMLLLLNCFCSWSCPINVIFYYASDYSSVIKLMHMAQNINRYYIKLEVFFT